MPATAALRDAATKDMRLNCYLREHECYVQIWLMKIGFDDQCSLLKKKIRMYDISHRVFGESVMEYEQKSTMVLFIIWWFFAFDWSDVDVLCVFLLTCFSICSTTAKSRIELADTNSIYVSIGHHCATNPHSLQLLLHRLL